MAKSDEKKSKHKDGKKVKAQVTLYNVPQEWIDLVKDSGSTFSSYAKHAVRQALKRDGLL